MRVLAGFAKFVLVLINLIFLAGGVFLVLVGNVARAPPKLQTEVHMPPVEVNPSLLYGVMALGGFIIVMSCLGCCGALFENKVLLGIYWCVLFLVIAGQLALGFLVRKEVADVANIESDVKTAWEQMTPAERNQAATDLECCTSSAASSPLDSTSNFNGTTACPYTDKPTCYALIVAPIQKAFHILFIVCVSMAGVEAVGFCLSFCLLCCTKKTPAGEDEEGLINSGRGRAPGGRGLGARGYDPIPAYQGSYRSGR